MSKIEHLLHVRAICISFSENFGEFHRPIFLQGFVDAGLKSSMCKCPRFGQISETVLHPKPVFLWPVRCLEYAHWKNGISRSSLGFSHSLGNDSN